MDSSFLVSLYVTDAHSLIARQRVPKDKSLGLTSLHRAEWAHAIGQHVYRRTLSPHEARQLHQQLEQDESNGVWVPVTVPENAFSVCADLGLRYGPKFGVRTLDSLHVACAVELQAKRFGTFDERQRQLAKAAGLDVR